jgi:hypothetical protein
MNDVSLEEQCKIADIAITADRLEYCHHQFYVFGDNFLADEIVQLARHYKDLTGLPYHHEWKHEYNGGHR